MKTILFLALVSLLPLAVRAQFSSLPDSVAKHLQKVPDSSKVTWLLEKGSKLTAAQPQQALPLLRAAKEIMLSRKDSATLPLVFNELAACYIQLESYSEALPLLLEAEKLLVRTKTDSLLIDTYTNLGIVYERTGKYQEAINYYHKVRSRLVAAGAPPMELARNLTNIGHAQEGLQLYKEALASYKQALTICEKNNIPFGIALLNQNIASVLLQEKAWPMSRRYSANSIKVADRKSVV